MFRFNWRFLFLLTYHATKERDCRDSCKKDRALEHQNVHLGSIEFRDSDFGSCIAGIYGQNGSGKTAVVDAFSCLKLLMCGRSLPAGAEGLIGPVSVQTEIAVEFEIQQGAARVLGVPADAESAIAGGKSFFAEYRFSFRKRESRIEFSSESIALRPNQLH